MGAGAAGLYAALCAAREGAAVVLVSATPLAQTASYWAQGGLAAALAADDSFELHLADTELAGRGLVRRSAAEILVREAPDRVGDLQRSACASTPTASAGSRSGSRAAIRCAASCTPAAAPPAGAWCASCRRWRRGSRGSRCSRARAHARCGAPRDRCRGLVCEDGQVIAARAVVLATGGAAALWARTTNPPGSQGSGLLLAHAAGACLADLELLQFHPTAVIGVPGREGFLVTEAIRGEGATLHDAAGERFVDELAPRDEVSRAIQARLQQTGARSVGLDMRAIDPAHFPNVVAALREAGLDPDARAGPGRAGRPLHDGRDRHRPARPLDARRPVRRRRVLLHRPARRQPAGLELAQRVLRVRPPRGRATRSRSPRRRARRRRARRSSRRCARCPTPPAADAATRAALWRDAGIVRTRRGLRGLLDDAHPLARLIARCALARTESRGAHRRLDYPERDPSLDHRHARRRAPTSSRGRPGSERARGPRTATAAIVATPATASKASLHKKIAPAS